VKKSLHERSFIKLFTQANWSHSQARTVMQACTTQKAWRAK